MTDKEKLVFGLKLIQEACHSDKIVEDFTFGKAKNFFTSEECTTVTFMMATGWEREPLIAYFDENDKFVKIE